MPHQTKELRSLMCGNRTWVSLHVSMIQSRGELVYITAKVVWLPSNDLALGLQMRFWGFEYLFTSKSICTFDSGHNHPSRNLINYIQQ